MSGLYHVIPKRTGNTLLFTRRQENEDLITSSLFYGLYSFRKMHFNSSMKHNWNTSQPYRWSQQKEKKTRNRTIADRNPGLNRAGGPGIKQTTFTTSLKWKYQTNPKHSHTLGNLHSLSINHQRLTPSAIQSYSKVLSTFIMSTQTLEGPQFCCPSTTA